MDDIPMWKCPSCEDLNAIGLDKCRCGELRPAAFSIKFIEPQSPLGLELLEKDTPTPPKSRKSPAKRQKGVSKKESKPKKKDALENDFYTAWQTYGTGHTVTRQYAVKSNRYVTPKRRNPKTYNIDFCWVGLKFCVEIQGGTYGNGAHSRGAGYAADRKRIRDLSFMGWIVWEYTTDDLKPNTLYDTILEVSAFIKQIEAVLVQERAA